MTTGQDETAMHTPKGSTGDVFLDLTPSDPIAPRRIGGLVMLPTAELDHLKDENVQMHVQLKAAQARIDAVRALCDSADRDGQAESEPGDPLKVYISTASIRSILDAYYAPPGDHDVSDLSAGNALRRMIQ